MKKFLLLKYLSQSFPSLKNYCKKVLGLFNFVFFSVCLNLTAESVANAGKKNNSYYGVFGIKIYDANSNCQTFVFDNNLQFQILYSRIIKLT